MPINRRQIQRCLETRAFEDLFIDGLGWDQPSRDTPYPVQLKDTLYELNPVAEKKGFQAYHCPLMPDSATRSLIESRLSRDVREHIIIFTDPQSKAQRWQWVRRIPGQPLSRKEHEYLPNQPLLLIEKLGYLEVGLHEEDQLDLFDVYDRVKTAFDIDKVTKKFFTVFQKEHSRFLDFIEGINDADDTRWYTSVMLNRMMFIYFIQKKGLLDGDTEYLRNRLRRVQDVKGKGQFQSFFYRYFLMALCHQVLDKRESDRQLDKDLATLVGTVPYLNGGIFQEHELEVRYPEINIPDEAFEKIFDFFDQYEWHLDNRPTANTNEINPDVLGYIFEKYINQKQMGAYYTKEDITEYISKNTIIPCLFDKAQKACPEAFEGNSAVWNLLKDDPDRYIYPSVRHGVTYDVLQEIERTEPVPYPKEIAIGLDTTQPELLERRQQWNTPAPPEAGLPTEIWRETVARRQHYAEIRQKLQNGEVRAIHDLITYNLDIRQFAQDVIERTEDPTLLNAFWVALAGRTPQQSNEELKLGITVLDPTGGSGAFLFAALNILEPLYEACLERMAFFLEQWGGQPQHPKFAKFFRSILDDINHHPSPKYFVYKTIIVQNLFGVDIMKEAVEICKLRLFLKLVAQVGDGEKIEPLPDIDFNIRAGNTLVGFATEDEMKRALSGDLLAYNTILPQILENAEECDRLFRLFREAQLNNDPTVGQAKAALRERLDELNATLNRYLAQDYGKDLRKKNALEDFLVSHQPFHWFVEFYGIIKNGGFDVIIGNPPYLESREVDYDLKYFRCLDSKAIHAMCIERSDILLNGNGTMSMIVPLSLPSTQRMEIVQQMLERQRSAWYANYSWRPAKLFDTVNRALTIFVVTPRNDPQTFSSDYQKWTSEDREGLFHRLSFIEVPRNRISCWVPKIGKPIEQLILNKCISAKTKIQNFTGKSQHKIFYRCDGGLYWKVFTDFAPAFNLNGIKGHSSRETFFTVHNRDFVLSIIAALSCDVFWWWYTVTSNLRHLNPFDVQNFPIPESALTDPILIKQGKDYLQDMIRNSTMLQRKQKQTGLTETQSFKIQKSKPIIDEIDKVLAKHYGFTEEELDFIINYDIKYRMGKELQEDEE